MTTCRTNRRERRKAAARIRGWPFCSPARWRHGFFSLSIPVRGQFRRGALPAAGRQLLQHGVFGLLHPYWPPFFPMTIAIFDLPVRNLEAAEGSSTASPAP